VIGLALSLTLSSFVQTALLIYFLRRKLGRLGAKSMFKSMLQQTAIAGIMGFMAYWICSFGDWSQGPSLHNIFLLGMALGISMLFYACVNLALKSEEALLIKSMIVSKFKKNSPSA